MRGPFEPWSDRRRWRFLTTMTIGVVVLGAVMLLVGRPMAANGVDIITFERAPSAERVDAILISWGESGRQAARTQTLLDFAWLVLYSLALSCALSIVAARARRSERRHFGLIATVAAALAWVAFVAGLLDAVENVALMAELYGHRGAFPRIASTAANAKFVLLYLCLVVALPGLALIGVDNLARRTGHDDWMD